MSNSRASRADSQRRTLPDLSYNIYLDVLEQKGQFYDLSGYAHLVLRYLGSRATARYGKELAWPKQRVIARHCGISRGSVQRALDELQREGWLEKEKRRVRMRDGELKELTRYIMLRPRSVPR
jgi:DNA-binding MarR family transcriptional regulator